MDIVLVHSVIMCFAYGYRCKGCLKKI